MGDTSLFRRVDTAAGTVRSLDSDREFTGSVRATGVADGNTAIDAVLENPSGSGTDIVVSATVATGGLAHLDLGTDISIGTSGSSIDTIPKDVESGTSATLNTDEGGSYTTNGTTLNTILPGTARVGGPSTQGAESPVSGALYLRPGEAVRYTITNQSGGNADFSLTFSAVDV